MSDTVVNEAKTILETMLSKLGFEFEVEIEGEGQTIFSLLIRRF